MLVVVQKPSIYLKSSDITEPETAYSKTCLLAMPSGGVPDNTNLIYEAIMSTGGTCTCVANNNNLTLNFTSPDEDTVPRGYTYEIDVAVSDGSTANMYVFTFTQNDVLKTKKPTLTVGATDGYTTCSTAASTTAKTISIGQFALSVGRKISVKFTYGNTASNPTLNVTSKGAYPIYFQNEPVDTDFIATNGIYALTFDGSHWNITPNKIIDVEQGSGVTMSFSSFDTFYWKEEDGTYPPSEW